MTAQGYWVSFWNNEDILGLVVMVAHYLIQLTLDQQMCRDAAPLLSQKPAPGPTVPHLRIQPTKDQEVL